MKCTNCGFEARENFEFCPNCGSGAAPSVPVSLNPAADVILSALRDKLFLLICIFMTASTVVYFLNGYVSVISVLMSVFLWLVYANACKGEANVNQLRNVSGVIYASYIINYVLSIFTIMAGGLISFVFSGNTLIKDEIVKELELKSSIELFEIIAKLPGVLIFVMFAVIGTGGIVYNTLSIGRIHRFAKSLYISADYGELKLEKVNAAKNWLIVICVFCIIESVNGLLNGKFIMAFSEGAVAIVTILANVLISKYFSDKN